jgi:hypothetical protein
MTKDGELVADTLVDADNFLLDARGQIVSADKAIAIGRGGEDTSILATGGQQRLSVRV